MSADEKKEIARDFIRATWARDAARVAPLMCNDSTHWTCGRLPRFTRLWTKAEFCALLRSESPFKENLTLTFGECIAEGDHVMLEVVGEGIVASTGKVYSNTYCFLFALRDGKIAKIRQYMDTQHMDDVLPLPPSTQA
jgi:uncharacterized protein